MALDSKESDIEQLRCQLSTLSVHSLDSTSISSGNDLDTSEGYPGRSRRLLGLLPASPTSALRVLAVFPLNSLILNFQAFFFHQLLTLTLYFPPSPLTSTALLGGPGAVRITHSHTSESMSFTYQRTHKSVCIDTRPRLRSTLFDSESEGEDERDGHVEQGPAPLALTYEQPPEAEPGGDPAWPPNPRINQNPNSSSINKTCF